MPRAPRNVSEALRDGGIPQHFDLHQVQWLMAKHTDLATRGQTPTSHDLWRLRWAFSCHDIAQTILNPRLAP